MDDARLIQAWIIATLGGVVGLGFFYIRRVEDGPSARYWGWAWLSFFLSLLASLSDRSLSAIVAHATGTGFPALLLAGALSLVGRSVPRHLVAFGLAVGTLRGVARVSGFEIWADAGVVLIEAPMDFLGAYVILANAHAGRQSPAVTALGVLYAIFGVLEMTNILFVLPLGFATVSYFSFGCLVTLLLANTQLLVLIERARFDHSLDLQLLHDVAQTGNVAREIESVTASALEFMRHRLDLENGAVWVMKPGVEGVKCVHYFGTSDEMPDELASQSVLHPVSQQVLATGKPVFFDDIQAQPLTIDGWYRELGVHSAALLPLEEGGQNLGVIAVGRFQVKPFNEAEQRILGIVVQELSLTIQHVLAVERLSEERRVLRSVIDASPTGILIANRDRQVEMLNTTFAEHFGEDDPEPWIGRSLVFLAADVAARCGEPEVFTQSFVDFDAETPASTTPITLLQPHDRDLLLFSGPIRGESEEELGRVWVTRDVSDERRLQEQLRQSQKMETLGTLAGGVAHDFNNQLTAILANARLLLHDRDGKADAAESLQDIERAAEHCADLTRSLLAFARRTTLTMQVIDPTAVLDELRSLLRSLLPSTIDFAIVTAPALPGIRADATQLQQILLNLVVNARDAIVADGRIRLDVRQRHVREARSPDARPGHYVEFSVSDDGAGMDAHIKSRIFDPFFTTKPSSEGTGLGLAVVYGAVRAHQGWVEVESRLGVGSTFRVLIPVAHEGATEQMAEERSPSVMGTETILLADDERMLRRVAKLMLEQSGYLVIEAEDGLKAVEVFEAHKDEIDLVLLDVTMPGLDGPGALEQIRKARPDMPAVMASGLPDLEPSKLGELTDFLAKPYDAESLVAAVRAILDRANALSRDM